METVFVLALIVVLVMWDRRSRKKPDRAQAPNIIDDADRGHRNEE